MERFFTSQAPGAAKPTTASPPAPAKFKELDFVEKKMEAIALVKMEENTI
jgi:hypothetical protein